MEENDAVAEQQKDKELLRQRGSRRYYNIIERKRNGRAFTSCYGSRMFLCEMNNFQREKERGVWRPKRERDLGLRAAF